LHKAQASAALSAGLLKDELMQLVDPNVSESEKAAAYMALTGETMLEDIKLDPTQETSEEAATATFTMDAPVSKDGEASEGWSSPWALWLRRSCGSEVQTESRNLRRAVQSRQRKVKQAHSALGACQGLGSHRPTWGHTSFFTLSEAQERISTMQRAMSAATTHTELAHRKAQLNKERRSSFSLKNSKQKQRTLSNQGPPEVQAPSTVPAIRRRQHLQQDFVQDNIMVERVEKIPMTLPSQMPRSVSHEWSQAILPSLVQCPTSSLPVQCKRSMDRRIWEMESHMADQNMRTLGQHSQQGELAACQKMPAASWQQRRQLRLQSPAWALPGESIFWEKMASGAFNELGNKIKPLQSCHNTGHFQSAADDLNGYINFYNRSALIKTEHSLRRFGGAGFSPRFFSEQKVPIKRVA